ncbi:MAG: mycofactocin-associated electron transfer flavoprotein alpha subunit [Acidimicrobiales bacterium]
MIAVVPVRAGELPAGAAETVAEAGGEVLLVGDRVHDALEVLREILGPAGVVSRLLETDRYGPGRVSKVIAPIVRARTAVILPAVPDGRDLAPRLAAELGWPLLAGALAVDEKGATLVWHGGRQLVRLDAGGPFVATLQPGARSVERAELSRSGELEDGAAPTPLPFLEPPEPVADAELLELVARDPAAVDLAEAPCIFAGGAGLGGEEEFALLARVAARAGASLGATRVVTDAGMVGHERQIGTTGVTVSPRCYVAFGISGAAQHLGGIGDPRHVISVNTDSSCPMMAMADLAIVSDAGKTLRALAAKLGIEAVGA